MKGRSDFDRALEWVRSWDETTRPESYARCWDAARCQGLPWPLCLVVFHIALQSGPRRARSLKAYNERTFSGLHVAPPVVRALILLAEYAASLDILISEDPSAACHRSDWFRRLGDLASSASRSEGDGATQSGQRRRGCLPCAVTDGEEIEAMKIRPLVAIACLAFAMPALAQTYLGNLSANRSDPDSISNPYGAGSPYKANGVNNPYSTYGSPFSQRSATNPYATQAPMLFDSSGNYRGNLSANPIDPNSNLESTRPLRQPLLARQRQQPLRRRESAQVRQPDESVWEGVEDHGAVGGALPRPGR